MPNNRIRVEYKRTVQTKPYESASVSMAYETDLKKDVDEDARIEEEFEWVKEKVETEVKHILEEE